MIDSGEYYQKDNYCALMFAHEFSSITSRSNSLVRFFYTNIYIYFLFRSKNKFNNELVNYLQLFLKFDI